MDTKSTVKIAAVGDLHCTRQSTGIYQKIFARVNEDADILVLCGDLTDYGTAEEAQVLIRELNSVVRIPIVCVLGNHDYESGTPETVKQILTEGGVKVLDGETCEFYGVGFAGAKGYIGGFGRYSLGAWGEEGIKNIVKDAQSEVMKVESALARLRTTHKVVLLHYSPIRATVEGEPVEIFPFLGNSRLEEPLLRHHASVVFHGHAHRGTLEGALMSGRPVYNVALPLLQSCMPDKPAYRIFDLAVSDEITPIVGEEIDALHGSSLRL
jgi:Icc-related predicted phosphoesterase